MQLDAARESDAALDDTLQNCCHDCALVDVAGLHSECQILFIIASLLPLPQPRATCPSLLAMLVHVLHGEHDTDQATHRHNEHARECLQ